MCERGPWCQAGMLNKWIAGRKPPNSSVILNIVAKRSDVSHDGKTCSSINKIGLLQEPFNQRRPLLGHIPLH